MEMSASDTQPFKICWPCHELHLHINRSLSLSGLIAFPIESHNPIYVGLFWLWDGGGDGHFIDCNSIVSEFGISWHFMGGIK